MKSVYITDARNDELGIETHTLLVTEAHALELLSIGRTAFRAGIKRGLYPPPVQLGDRRIAWRYSDLYDCVQALPYVEWRGLKPGHYNFLPKVPDYDNDD